MQRFKTNIDIKQMLISILGILVAKMCIHSHIIFSIFVFPVSHFQAFPLQIDLFPNRIGRGELRTTRSDALILLPRYDALMAAGQTRCPLQRHLRPQSGISGLETRVVEPPNT